MADPQPASSSVQTIGVSLVTTRSIVSVVRDDDEDWVGEPPEGRYSADRAKPDFWRSQWPVSLTAVGIFVVIAILVIVYALR